jgi:hypothetical protein
LRIEKLRIQAAKRQEQQRQQQEQGNDNSYSGKFSDSDAGNVKCFPRFEIPKIISQVANMIVIEQPIQQ